MLPKYLQFLLVRTVHVEFLHCEHANINTQDHNSRALQAALLRAGRRYLRGCGAGLHPGAELVLCDLAAGVPAVEQAARHRVLLPGEPARITKTLPARKGVSCTGRKTPLWLPTRCGGCCIDKENNICIYIYIYSLSEASIGSVSF